MGARSVSLWSSLLHGPRGSGFYWFFSLSDNSFSVIFILKLGTLQAPALLPSAWSRTTLLQTPVKVPGGPKAQPRRWRAFRPPCPAARASLSVPVFVPGRPRFPGHAVREL